MKTPVEFFAKIFSIIVLWFRWIRRLGITPFPTEKNRNDKNIHHLILCRVDNALMAAANQVWVQEQQLTTLRKAVDQADAKIEAKKFFDAMFYEDISRLKNVKQRFQAQERMTDNAKRKYRKLWGLFSELKLIPEGWMDAEHFLQDYNSKPISRQQIHC